LRCIEGGAQLVTLAGSKPMDPLDPALQALALAGASLAKHGVPAHPGTLLWLAWLPARSGVVPIIGMPSCGLFSKATMFDLILPRLLAGERLGKRELAAYGDGGLLSKDALWRFPPYRPQALRGELAE
jgi:molybdopterin biosynthesis enzyme